MKRGFLLVVDLTSVFLFTGIIFGWAPLNSILLEEGFYSFKCENEAPCDAQANALNLAFTYATTFFAVVSVPAGMLADKFGPAVGTVVAAVLEISGLLGIALCEPYRGFDLFLISFNVIAVGGAFTMYNAYSAPFLFKANMNVVIELTACLFDGSCIIFTFFKMAYDAGVPFATIWWSYVGIACGIYALLFLFWVLNAKEVQASRAVDSAPPDDHVKTSPHTDTLSAQPFLKQVRSFEFIAVCSYAMIQSTRSNLYLGSVGLINYEYKLLYDWHHVDRLLSIIGLIIPLGFTAVPFIELSIHYLGLIGTFMVSTALGLLYNGLQLVPAQSAQILGAVVFAIFRAFLFSILAAFNGATFGPNSMGSIMGMMMCLSSIVNLCQAPLVEASLAIDDFNPLTIGSILSSVPPTLLVLLLAWVQHRRLRNSSTLGAPLLERATLALEGEAVSRVSEASSRATWRASSTAFGAAPKAVLRRAVASGTLLT